MSSQVHQNDSRRRGKEERQMNDAQLVKDMKSIVLNAGKEVFKLYGKAKIQYTKKHEADIVTQADLLSHKIISSFIRKKYSSHGIISEEDKDYKRSAEYVWIVDPLDGTRNFKSGLPYFAIMVAIMKNNKVITSAIYLPFFKELYFAQEGKGAYLNNKKIICSSQTEIRHSIGVLDVCFINLINKEKVKKLTLAEETTNYWITNLSCIGAHSMIVADGRRDWFCQPKAGGLWDFAPAYMILKESGCIVTNMDGKPWSINDGDMIAANPQLHKKIMEIIK
jgi:myo-inositol-1(or 4)-monophosphatase